MTSASFTSQQFPLEPIEKASIDELRALQLKHSLWQARAALEDATWSLARMFV